MKHSLTSLLTVLILSNAAIAQEPQKPGDEHKKLYDMVGTWDCVMKMTGAEDSKGVSVYKRALSGMWIETDFEGTFGGEPFNGKGFDSYDSAKKKYVSVWMDSTSGSPSVFEGSYDEAGNVLTMLSQSTGPDGSPMTMKSVSTHVDADHMNFTMLMVGADKSETEIMSIAYSRRPAEASDKVKGSKKKLLAVPATEAP